MSRIFLDKLRQPTQAGEMIVNMNELDFLYHLTGVSDPQEAIERFAISCLMHWKEPQDVLKALDISPIEQGQVYFHQEGSLAIPEVPKESAYQRIQYEVVRKK